MDQENTNVELLHGGSWWAVIEGESGVNPTEPLRYSKVIAWERVVDESGDPQLRAWINGLDPVRSDRFNEDVSGWILNSYTTNPASKDDWSWS